MAAATGVAVWWCWPRRMSELDYGPRPVSRSDDLVSDLKLMWQTADRVSTPEAIHAAERVFASVEFNGLTRDEVVSRIGDPTSSSDNRYNFPFYPTGPEVLVYRFDSGAWRCQYRLFFGADGKVRRVQYLMIE